LFLSLFSFRFYSDSSACLTAIRDIFPSSIPLTGNRFWLITFYFFSHGIANPMPADNPPARKRAQKTPVRKGLLKSACTAGKSIMSLHRLPKSAIRQAKRGD
jgi:hypothetical protein